MSKDCNVCTVCNSVKDPVYFVFLRSIVKGYEDVEDFYTFSNEGKLIEFLLSLDYDDFSIRYVGSVSGHDFTYAWEV